MLTSYAGDATSSTCALVSTATQHEASQPTCSYNDEPASSINTKLSGQRSYLQSLDRTSRAWVLSSGKSHESDNLLSPREDNGSNIWYNPIPEDEATGSPLREEVIWKRRSEKIGVPKNLETETRVQLEGEDDGPLDPLTLSHQAEDISAEKPGKRCSRVCFMSHHTTALSWIFSITAFQTRLPQTLAPPLRRKDL